MKYLALTQAVILLTQMQPEAQEIQTCLQIPIHPPKREPAPPKPKFKKTWHKQGKKRK